MPDEVRRRLMTDDEWWAGLDRELNEVAGATFLVRVLMPIKLTAAILLTAWLFLQ